MKKNKKQHLLNREIRAHEVRVTEGGIMSLNDAIQLAESKEMDLVLISESSTPPVCKIMNYEKFAYELGKKPKNKTLEMKEIKLGPNTSDNDLNYRIKHTIEFLQKGHKVRISMQFKGREMTYIDNGKALLLKMVVAVEEAGVPEAMPSVEGKKMFVTLKPKSGK